MKIYNFKYSAKRLKKIWIFATSKNTTICIEINVIDNIGNINWINNRENGHDKFLDTLGIEKDQEVIQQALEFAKELKQYQDIKNKYN